MEHTEVLQMSREDRLRKWVTEYSDAVLRVCFLYLADRSQAEDALQDTWIKVWNAMERFDVKEIQHEKAWLMRIAVNICKDYRRSAWFRHIDKRKALDELPPRFVMQEEKESSLSFTIMELPDRYKQVVLLYYYQGMTLEETGEALRLSASTVSRRLKKAEELLKKSLTGGAAYED